MHFGKMLRHQFFRGFPFCATFIHSENNRIESLLECRFCAFPILSRDAGFPTEEIPHAFTRGEKLKHLRDSPFCPANRKLRASQVAFQPTLCESAPHVR